MTTVFQKFVDRFNKSSELNPASQSDIHSLESNFNIHLPADYKQFLMTYGNIWTPDLLDIIVDNEVPLNEVQQFWEIDRIIEDKKNEWTSKLSFDLIPFASDSMGNIYAFKTSDLKYQSDTADIYFFDHDYDTVDKISDSFTEWLDRYNRL